MLEMKKKNNKRKISPNKIFKRIGLILVSIFILLGFIAVGYYKNYIDGLKLLGSSQKKEQLVTTKEQLKTVLPENKNGYAIKGASHEYEGGLEPLNKPEKAVIDRSVKTEEKEIKKPLKREEVVEKIEQTSKDQVNESMIDTKRAKLAIIIDDLSFAKEVQALRSLHIPLTMSFLPPTSVHPDSAKLAANESFYMVHLPMEAVNFNATEPLTLKVDDSQQLISNRIDEIIHLFPRVHYINNHTGSKFTADEESVKKLIISLKKNNIHFIDSRTTADTKVEKVMQEEGERYIGRDVFLDHTMDVRSVKKQIVEAVRIAKTKGYAVAIGHPHPNTIQALRESKALLSQVDLVLINKI